MVSTCPSTSKSSSPFSNPLVTVPNAPITIGIIFTCMFHSFFNSLARLMVFHWSLSDSKSLRVSTTLFSILTDLNNAEIWMMSTRPLIFQAPQSFYHSFGDCTQNTNYNWYKRHFHIPQFFQFPCEVEVFILLFTFFQFYSVVTRDSKVHNFASSLSSFFFFFFFFLLIIRCSVCMSKFNRNHSLE